ncbi:MAG: hypothetical protein IJ313_06385 [Clostridia bacterium]|nr:hypothetical protein [Clostridia bacterium]
MKARIAIVLTLALLFVSAAALAEMVSVAELYDQAQAMGGVWQETFDTSNGQVTVDAPIIVPDIEKMPVITVEAAKPLSKEMYDMIAQGEKTSKSKTAIQFEIDLDDRAQEFFLGYEEDGKTGYDAVDCAWVQRGSYRFTQGGGAASDAKPATQHYPWELDFNQPYARGSEQTLSDIMKIWEEDIRRCYPDGEYVVKPKRIYINGSTLVESNGDGKKYKRNGDYFVYGEQYINGLPLVGAIGSRDGENKFWLSHASSTATNRVFDRLEDYCIGSFDVCHNQIRFLSANDEDNRSMNDLNKVRSVEYEDVPLASLEEVLSSIETAIEAGHIREVFAVRLGYLLYSNPDMTDYAWAIPRWIVDCYYIDDENEKQAKRFHESNEVEKVIWEAWEFLQMPIDAQSAEAIFFRLPDEETYRVPEITTWDDVQ